MSNLPTLSTAPVEHLALDYALLRREGIRHLESLAGHLWTDFNTHDPGITILEQLCYAITDLAYRASHDLPDLLATSGVDPYQSLYSAATILTSHPVTLLDVRKVALDVKGVKNAWIEEVPELDPKRLPLHLHEAKRELRFLPDPPYTTPVRLKGLVRVLIETLKPSDEEVRQAVARRLHACRPLCVDFHEIRVLAPQPVKVIAEVEIGPVDDAERVFLDIYQALSEYVSPSITFKTLGEMLAAGKQSDEVFDGPVLEHGFLDSEALEQMDRKAKLYASDLLREIMGIPGVRAVRNIVMSKDNETKRENSELELDTTRAPRLDLEGSSITLVKGPLKARLDTHRLIAMLKQRREKEALNRHLSPGDRDFIPPVGRDRNIKQYRSIQHELPAIYGVGAAGLPTSATPRRKAQAKQLQAYLLFFDQLLASYFAQLANAGSLFSFYGEDTRTYFTQMVEDPSLALATVQRGSAEEHRKNLSKIAEDQETSGSLSNRKNRFYNHLMARFAEQFTDYSLVLFGAAGLVPDKQAFLRRYPRISSARGTGRDALSPAGVGDTAGLQERIERKLGLTDNEQFLLVEHLLLAPTEEDYLSPRSKLEVRQLPFLSNCMPRDPYSLQLSFVLPKVSARMQDDQFQRFVEQTIREETPAHLIPYIRWLEAESDWSLLNTAYNEWLDAYRDYQVQKLDPLAKTDSHSFRARAARDRLIDLIKLGATYPLRDLPVRDEHLTVPYNQSAQIPIESSQRDVVYELRDANGAPVLDANGQPARDANGQPLRPVNGNGGKIHLPTPPMREDTTYNILARKIDTHREVYLQQQATVKVGLDVTLSARIAAPLLEAINPPGDSDARIVAWGTRVSVQIDNSQEGVDYRLVQLVGEQEQTLSDDVRGTGSLIELLAKPASEDVAIRIRATKVFDPSENLPTQTDLLKAVLPLKVRARRDLPVSLEPSPIVDFKGKAVVRIDNTQASTQYLLYVRDVSDSDFVFGTTGGLGLLGVDVAGEPRVHVQRPPQQELWENLAGFQPVGAPTPGNGGTLRLPVSALTQDSVILVRAHKEHQGRAKVPSMVQLQQAALLLTRPNPQPELKLGVEMAGAQTTGTLEVSGGQPGVFYEVRSDPAGNAFEWPAYFHKTDERDATLNKGLGQLRIEVDFVITRGTLRPATTPAELASTPPLTPLLSTGPIAANTTLHLRAIKAQTRVATNLPKTAQIAPVPEIVAEQAVVPKGSPAEIVVRASLAGDRYQLTQAGQPIGPAFDGNGGELTFTTVPLQAATQFEVLVTRPGEAGIPVERWVRINVGVA
jgi:hypothetical protein